MEAIRIALLLFKLVLKRCLSNHDLLAMVKMYFLQEPEGLVKIQNSKCVFVL